MRNEKVDLFAYIQSLFKNMKEMNLSPSNIKRYRDYAAKSIEFYTETKCKTQEERAEMLNYLREVESVFDNYKVSC